MSTEKKQWIIKDPDGRIQGPFTTEQILSKIGQGDISGDEMISLYPGGQWISISQDPQFYDRLLEVLSGVVSENDDEVTDPNLAEQMAYSSLKPPVKKGRAQKVEETQGPTQPSPSTPPPESTKPKSKKNKNKNKNKKKSSRAPEGEVIELQDLKKVLKDETAKKSRIPLILATILLLLIFSVLFITPPPESERIHLVGPQKGGAPLSSEQIQTHVRKALPEFLQDTFSGYLKAQNEFVQVIEGDSRNLEVMALLCITYWELWPFTFQDSKDLKTIQQAAQMSSAVDPTGPHSATCKAIDLMVRGRVNEAKSLVESVLDSSSNAQQPPIVTYYLKALLLESSGDIQTAIGYLNSAQQLWPQWIRVYAEEATNQQKLNNFNAAAKIYNKILKANPKHNVSKVELGLLEHKIFRHPTQAQTLIEEGLNAKDDKVPRYLASRGYFGLAEIELQRNNHTRALEYAQKAYQFNSGNIPAKNLIVQLGGVEKLKKTKVKGQQLVFEGDQLVREGDCQSAQALYRAAFEEESKNAIAAMKAAQCLWELSFSTEAIEWLNKAIRADAKMIEAYVLLADYYTKRFNFDAAARILATAQKISPKSYEVYRGFALVEYRRNNPAGALSFGKKALALYETDVDTHNIMAQAALVMKDYRQAYTSASKAVELDPNNQDAQITYAQSLAGIQGVDVGVDYLKRLVATYPLVVNYQIALGKILLEDERYDAAASVFRQIMKINNKQKEAMLLLGKVLRAENHFDQSLEILLKAAVLDPADPEPLFQAGLLYLEARKAESAKIQFQRVLRINPYYPLVHYYLGKAALTLNKPEEALAEAKEERKGNPNLAESYLLAAEAYSEMKQYGLCAEEYQRAIKLRPQGASIYVKVGRCYRLAGNIDVAMSMLNFAATQESGNADIYKEQGQIYEMKGDLQRAIEAYNQYFVLDPGAPDKELILNRIQALQRGGVTF